MMTELFAQLAQPNRLRALALEPMLDWAADALNRVDAATIRATLPPTSTCKTAARAAFPCCCATPPPCWGKRRRVPTCPPPPAPICRPWGWTPRTPLVRKIEWRGLSIQVRAALIKEHGPRDKNPGPQRAARRAEQANSREELAKRFETEQARAPKERSALRKTLAERHRAERQQLSTELRHERAAGIAENKVLGLGPQNAISQWAFEAPKRREALQKQKRQAGERRELTQKIPRTQVWRAWLE